MSWDVVVFSTAQKITSVEEIDESQFVLIDFNAILEKHFENILRDDDHREIRGQDCSINYFVSDDLAGNMLFNLYGEHSLYELIRISKIHGWQIFDTGSGEMIDLDHPDS